LLVVGLAETWALSPLLATMAMGFTSRNLLRTGGDRLFAPIEYLEEMVFILFFTLAGVHFDLGVFFTHMDLIMTYFLARIVGKVVGAAIGAGLSGAPVMVTRWLGLALIPQAGVAVGLALTLGHQPAYHEISLLMVNVILATTLLYELLGPLAARFALGKAGELGVKRERKRP
jgi:Kef-type K+ transport system membrane component KefB